MNRFKRALKTITDFKLPKLLTANNVQLSQDELMAVTDKTAIERQWYSGVPVFENTAQILAAAHTHRLVPIAPTVNYAPILRLRNPKLIGEYPAYLTTEAAALLDEIARSWRRQADQEGIEAGIRLSVTSLLRTNAYQQLIVQAGKLAMSNSPHTRGEAFDIDGSGYYLGDTPINARSGRQREWQQAFHEMGADMEAPQFGSYDLYNPRVHQLLQVILEEFKSTNKLNYVLEYEGTTNACFHICRNPDYRPSQDGLK